MSLTVATLARAKNAADIYADSRAKSVDAARSRLGLAQSGSIGLAQASTGVTSPPSIGAPGDPVSPMLHTRTIDPPKHFTGVEQPFSLRPVQEIERSRTFGSLVEKAAREALSDVRHGERMSKLGVLGRVDTQSVVEALSAAELTIQSVVAIRDRVVGAYQEILRMQI
jgi:flagellar hook-basal body complex protein FliE